MIDYRLAPRHGDEEFDTYRDPIINVDILGCREDIYNDMFDPPEDYDLDYDPDAATGAIYWSDVEEGLYG